MITERSIKLLSSVMLSTNWIKVFRLCFEDWPIRILTFAWWMLKARNTIVSWQAFPSLPPHAHLAFLSCLNNSLFLPFQTPSTQASCSTELKFWFVGREFNQQTNKSGFPWYKTNSKPDLRGGKERSLQNFLLYSMSLSFVIWNVSVLLWGLQKGLLFGLCLKFSTIHAAKFAMNKKSFYLKELTNCLSLASCQIHYYVLLYFTPIFPTDSLFQQTNKQSDIHWDLHAVIPNKINEPSLVSMVWSLIILWRGEMKMILSRPPFN